MDQPNQPINLNTASLDEIKKLPGMGSGMAKRLVAARPFHSVEDLRKVKGFREDWWENVASLVTFSTTPAEAVAAVTPEDAPAQPIAPQSEPAPGAPEMTPEPEAELQLASPALPSVALLEEEPSRASTSENQPPAGSPIPAPVLVASEPAAAPRGISVSGAVGIALVSSLLTCMLSVALVLGILTALNGGLNYADTAELAALKRQVSKMESQATIVEEEVANLRNRLDNLDALAGRLDTLEKELTKIRSEIQAASQQANKVGQQVDKLSTAIQEVKDSTKQFQNFLDGLRKLLEQPSQP